MSEQNYLTALHRATEALGSESRARDWLTSVSATLGDTPENLCSTPEGLARVLRHIHSVELALATDG